MGADHTYFGHYLEDLENDFTQGVDQYPKSNTDADHVLANWKQDPCIWYGLPVATMVYNSQILPLTMKQEMWNKQKQEHNILVEEVSIMAADEVVAMDEVMHVAPLFVSGVVNQVTMHLNVMHLQKKNKSTGHSYQDLQEWNPPHNC